MSKAISGSGILSFDNATENSIIDEKNKWNQMVISVFWINHEIFPYENIIGELKLKLKLKLDLNVDIY